MGHSFPTVPDQIGAWLQAQPVYFVATAPLAGDGHVNVSPKGDDTFRVLGPSEVAYLDLTGSGIETVAHVRENGRITVLFSSFDETPRLVRVYGRGEAVVPGDPRWDGLMAHFPERPGVRGVIRVDVERVSTSCGYGVPLMELVGPRTRLVEGHERRGEAGLAAYRAETNARSIDGLPGLDPATP